MASTGTFKYGREKAVGAVHVRPQAQLRPGIDRDALAVQYFPT